MLAYGLGIGLSAADIKFKAGGLNREQAVAIGIVLALSLIISRWLLKRSIGNRAPLFSDGLRWAFLLCLVAYVMRSYVRCALVGAGDAYHYSLTLADFVTQMRSGIYPVFVGQTAFAFNGGIHTVRTAPYFTHLGGLLDVLTLHTLPPFALTNLALFCSAMLGTLGAYMALLVYAPERHWVALFLAALYILSPAILAPLFESDMIATFMAVPMIPWLALGLALAVNDPNRWKPWVIQATAIAGMWWAHPPIAVWATSLSAAACCAVLVRPGVTRVGLARITVSAFLCGILAIYVFASVATLNLPPGPDEKSDEVANIIRNLSGSWRASFALVSTKGDNPLGDIQLGYGILIASFAAFLVPSRRKAAFYLFAYILCILVFLVPLPWVTAWLWSCVPKRMLDVTNNWPIQRLYPILAGLGIFASLAGLAELKFKTRRSVAVAIVAVIGTLTWSTMEAQKLFLSAARNTMTPERSALLFDPQNVALSRVSYMFFGFLPGYFSNGEMEPILETRLLDASTLAVIADGTSRLSALDIAGVRTIDIQEDGGGNAWADVTMEAGQRCWFYFDFLGREPRGELTLTGHALERLYALPSSGGEKSFGAGPKNGRVMSVENHTNQPELVRIRYVPEVAGISGNPSGLFARVTIEPFQPTDHVIELRSLMPFNAVIHAPRKAILETPRVDVPGYRAEVNGREATIVRTGEGLVGVAVPVGKSDVSVIYSGNKILRLAYIVSVTSWIAFGICLVGMSSGFQSSIILRIRAGFENSIERWISPVLIITVCGIAVTVIGPHLWRWANVSESGYLSILIRLPAENAGVTEPLLTTGQTGHGDVIYVKFLGGNHVSIGRDHWGYGAETSEPIEVDFGLPQRIDISMKSLARTPILGPKNLSAQPNGLRVKWNGREIIASPVDSYQSPGLEIGSNLIGASSCGRRFTGEVLEVRSISEEEFSTRSDEQR
jgi:hypothetical protein